MLTLAFCCACIKAYMTTTTPMTSKTNKPAQHRHHHQFSPLPWCVLLFYVSAHNIRRRNSSWSFNNNVKDENVVKRKWKEIITVPRSVHDNAFSYDSWAVPHTNQLTAGLQCVHFLSNQSRHGKTKMATSSAELFCGTDTRFVPGHWSIVSVSTN